MGTIDHPENRTVRFSAGNTRLPPSYNLSGSTFTSIFLPSEMAVA